MAPTSRPQTPPSASQLRHGQLTPPSTAGKDPATPQKRGTKSLNQLLTPPSTAASSKAVRFALDPGIPTKSKCRLLRTKDDDESTLDEFTELDDPSDLRDVSVSDESPGSSSPLSPTEDPESSQPPIAADKPDQQVSSGDDVLVDTAENVATNIATNMFPFMKLPMSVRKRVYEILLVVPGLICVRQNHTSYHSEKKAFLYAENRQLLPGIAYALPQVTVNGFKIRFSRFPCTNAAILCASKEVHGETKAILYGANDFEVVCPNLELSPPPDYKTKLFPRQSLVQCLSICVRALYPLKWLLNGGFGELKNAYRGLDTLTIIFEAESCIKGAGKVLSKKENEGWVAYVKRLHVMIATEVFAGNKDIKTLPVWINLRVHFDGEAYADTSKPSTHSINVDLGPGNANPTGAAEERLRRYTMKRGLPEAFEMFKKRGR